MVVGLVLVGTIAGGLAAALALLAAQPLSSVIAAYLVTGVLSILVIAVGCSFRAGRISDSDDTVHGPSQPERSS